MSPELEATLLAAAPALERLDAAWWLIGSAAMALLGAEVEVADVDILASPEDALALARAWGVAPKTPEPDPFFQSDVYFTWAEPPLPVEVMAGFKAYSQGWREVRPRTRVPTQVGGRSFYTPDLAEMIELLQLFDRPKDRQRVEILRGLGGL